MSNAIVLITNYNFRHVFYIQWWTTIRLTTKNNLIKHWLQMEDLDFLDLEEDLDFLTAL